MPKFFFTIRDVHGSMHKKGWLTDERQDRIVRRIQKVIVATVIRKQLPIIVTVSKPGTRKVAFRRRYNTIRDFKKLGRLPKWRKLWKRRASYDRPNLIFWYVACKKEHPLCITRLPYEPRKKTLLYRKRKKLRGPFLSYKEALENFERMEKVYK